MLPCKGISFMVCYSVCESDFMQGLGTMLVQICDLCVRDSFTLGRLDTG